MTLRIWRFTSRYGYPMLIDALLILLSFHLAITLRFAGGAPGYYLNAFRNCAVFIVFVYLVFNYLLGLYNQIWRYASSQEVIAILESVTLSTLILTAIDILWLPERPLPVSTVVSGGFFTFCFSTATRYRSRLVTGFLWRWRALWRRGSLAKPRAKTLIVGAGEAGQLLAWQLQNRKEGRKYEVVGFIDDDQTKWGMRVHGLKIFGGRGEIPTLVASKGIGLIIIAIQAVSGDDFRDILSTCQDTQAQIKLVPDVFEAIENTNDDLAIRDITIEDLLGRRPTQIDHDTCRRVLGGKVVLVTGAGGSIGSELCRQIVPFQPKLLIMLDNNETSLHDLSVELRFKENLPPLEYIVGDVTNAAKMERVFREHRPQVIFHAAAYKHVPLMEHWPDEAIRVNVGGTRIMSQLALKYAVERFVFISSDKAVNPNCIMGITKCIGEMLVSKMPCDSGTIGTAVRFGNVLGSRGSVVPTFQKQIDMGGPVTITHPGMRRFFMSIPEAVSLVIQAASLAKGGEVFILDMGEDIRIVDLAHKMIRLQGLRVGEDIQIICTGVRPGEKLREELSGEGEKRYPTSHPRIQCIRSDHYLDRDILWRQVDELVALAEAQRNGQLRAKLHKIVKGERDLR